MRYEYRSNLVRAAVLAAAAVTSTSALADADLDLKVSDSSNWAEQDGDYSNHRYSELKQVNASNVGKLQVAWTMSTGVLRGHEGSPLVVGDTMYIHTPFPNNVFAVNLKDQTYRWKYEPKQDADVVPVMCCDTVNRGLAYGDGKIFLQQADTTLVALDARTGKVAWTAKNGNPKIGETNTNAPHVFKDKVLTGISGGEFGVRGRVVAYDIKTGKQVWKGYSTGPDAEMLMDPAKTMTWTNGKMAAVGKDSSLKSWQGEQWKLGGGTTWGWYSYDPKLDLIYYGTGNPGSWNPTQRLGDNRWSMSIIARNPDTGVAAWAFQMTPHDGRDYDGVTENVLFDATVKGQNHPALAHFDRNGYAYVLDRTNGKLLAINKFDPTVNWATGIDAATGKPTVDPTKMTKAGVNVKNICPAAEGDKDEQPASYDPATHLFYVPTNHICMDYQAFDVKYKSGFPFVGAILNMYAASPDIRGRFIAFDPITGDTKWAINDR